MPVSDQLSRLPALRPGINLLRRDHPSQGAIQSLVLNEMIVQGGDAVWVDSHGNASTHAFNRIAPDERFLERIRVARAFTAYQHFSLTTQLLYQVDRKTAVTVLPEIDHFYAGDLQPDEDTEMLEAALGTVEEVVARYRIPVLVSTAGRLTDTVTDHVDRVIDCRVTGEGVRFESDDFRTLVYRGNGYIQTTLELFRLLVHKQYVTQNPVQEAV